MNWKGAGRVRVNTQGDSEDRRDEKTLGKSGGRVPGPPNRRPCSCNVALRLILLLAWSSLVPAVLEEECKKGGAGRDPGKPLAERNKGANNGWIRDYARSCLRPQLSMFVSCRISFYPGVLAIDSDRTRLAYFCVARPLQYQPFAQDYRHGLQSSTARGPRRSAIFRCQIYSFGQSERLFLNGTIASA
ncbi:hypothetical protein EDB84DRAFT_1653010 [Lactarius hengduanensis]|nr:hypothetical protein EDB84DRAFT_1653010 [Lactarius hengduanensis]